MQRCCRNWALVVGLALSSGFASADEPTETAPDAISYQRQVLPIFREQCHGCHQPAKAGGEYVMTDFAALLKGGETELPGVVPGDAEESQLMWEIVAEEGEKPSMPKGRDPLHESQVAVIRQWIAEGAKDDRPPSAAEAVDADHPPQYVASPVLTSLDYSPDGGLLAVSGYHEVLLHSADGSQLVARLVGRSERIQSLGFSPDGKLLAVVGGSPGRFGEVQIWDVATRTLKLSLAVTFDTLYGASWSHDGTKLAFGCGDNTVRAIDAATGTELLYQGAHEDWVLDTVFSNDSSHLVSVSRDRSMKLTEVATQRFVDNITSITPGALKGGLIVVDRRPGTDELLVGGADGSAKLYQMHRTKARQIGDDHNLIRVFESLPGRVFAVDFNADGSRLAVGSSRDGSGEIRVYQTEDAKQVSQIAGLEGGIYTLAFRPDGTQVASGGFGGVVRINNVETGELVREFVPVPLAADAVASAATE